MYLKYNGKPLEKHKEHVFSEWWPFSTLNQNDSDRALRKCTLDIQLFQLALKSPLKCGIGGIGGLFLKIYFVKLKGPNKSINNNSNSNLVDKSHKFGLKQNGNSDE